MRFPSGFFFVFRKQYVDNCFKVAFLHDTLSREESSGLKLPEWTKAVYPNETYKCQVRFFQLMTETDDMKHFRGGPIITEIYNGMSRYQNGSSARNLYTYSAHDATIATVLAALEMDGQTNPTPDFGACLVFEMRRISNGDQDIEDIVQVS